MKLQLAYVIGVLFCMLCAGITGLFLGEILASTTVISFTILCLIYILGLHKIDKKR